MKRTIILALPCLIALIALSFGANAGPGAIATGHINSTACGKLPSPLSVAVRLADDTEANMELREVLLRRLEDAGVTVADDAPATLNIEVVRSSQATIHKGPDLGEFSDGTGQHTRFRMNVWSSQADSIMGGRRDRILSRSFDRLRIAIYINSRADGRCLWQGEAVHDLGGADARFVSERMIPALVDSLGTSVAGKPFQTD